MTNQNVTYTDISVRMNNKNCKSFLIRQHFEKLNHNKQVE